MGKERKPRVVYERQRTNTLDTMLCGSANSQFTHTMLQLLFFPFLISPPHICVAQSQDRHVPRTYANNPLPSHSSCGGTRSASHWHEGKRVPSRADTFVAAQTSPRLPPHRGTHRHHPTLASACQLLVVDVVHSETNFRCTEQQHNQQVFVRERERSPHQQVHITHQCSSTCASLQATQHTRAAIAFRQLARAHLLCAALVFYSCASPLSHRFFLTLEKGEVKKYVPLKRKNACL